MSRLSFKENEYSDDGEGEPIAVYTNEQSGYVDSDVSDSEILKSSYALYGIDPGSLHKSGSPMSGKAANKQLQAKLTEGSANLLSTTSMVAVDDPVSVHDANIDSSKSKSTKKKRKKRKLDESQYVAIGEDVSSAVTTVAAVRESKFLSKFLSTKRELQEVPEPPEIEPANNSFLKLFQDTFIPSSSAAGAGTDEDSSDNDSAYTAPSPARPAMRVLSSASMNTSTEDERAAPISVPVADGSLSNTVALQFFNLPYRISPEQLQAFGKKRGYKFTSVVMGVDWKTKLPSGSATVHVEFDSAMAAPPGVPPATKEENEELPLYADLLDEEVAECIQALQGEDCGGRPLRVQRFIAKKRQSGSMGGRGDARYFSEDISCKCHNCGLVGHRQQECTNDSMPLPCHLCAGLDHEAGGCPNITCYRCGKFGHHSRDCTFASMSRPVICTNCGSNRHDIRGCRELSVHYKPGLVIPDSKVAGPLVRCMSCNTYGHVMCQSLPEIPAATADAVYCPNCGENGHHIDFPQLCREVTTTMGGGNGAGDSGKKRKHGGGPKSSAPSQQCMEPKYEAFVKFPSMLAEIDDVPTSERLEYFELLTRRSSHSDRMLFPPLARRFSGASSSSGAQSSNAKSRHSIGGNPDARDIGRSVVQYQEGVQRLQQNAAPQNERERFASALEAVTSGRKVGYDRSGADYYDREQDAPGSGHKRAKTSHGHAPPQQQYQQQYQQQHQAGGSRRHSYPLNVPQRHENQSRGGYGGNIQHHGGGQQHSGNRWDNSHGGGRQAAPSVLDPAWTESAYYPQAPCYYGVHYGSAQPLSAFPILPPPPAMPAPRPPPPPLPLPPPILGREVTTLPTVSAAAGNVAVTLEVLDARKRRIREWAASRFHS